MRQFAIACGCAIALIGCQKSGTPGGADTTKPPQAPPPPPALSLSSVAGKWNLVSTPQAGGTDTTSTKSVLVATADTTGWTLTLPGGKPMALHVVAAGDSVVLETGPFQSVRRKGMKVALLHSVSRLQDGKLVGITTAHYVTTKPDSVLQLNTVGTKAP